MGLVDDKHAEHRAVVGCKSLGNEADAPWVPNGREGWRAKLVVRGLAHKCANEAAR